MTNKQSHVDRNADITISCTAEGDRCVQSSFDVSDFTTVLLLDMSMTLYCCKKYDSM